MSNITRPYDVTSDVIVYAHAMLRMRSPKFLSGQWKSLATAPSLRLWFITKV